MKPTYKKNCFRSLLLIASLTNIMMQYSYPARKSSKYSFTVYKDRKIDDSSNTIETHSDYKECITSCYNKKENCKSIDAKTENNITLTCRFFKNDFPKTMQAEGFLFILAKPPNCSLSCSLAMSTCGKCDCNPSCAARNRRQHVCNCTNAAGVAKNCQEHHNNGFNKTGVYQISPNGSTFEVVCEMGKVEQQNPRVTNPICNTLQSNLQTGFNNLVSYCVVTCAKYSQINTMFFSKNLGCYCGRNLGRNSGLNVYSTQWDYCTVEPSSKSCTLSKVYYGSYIYFDTYIYIGYISWSSCLSFCVDYQKKYPTQNGYVASAIVDVYGDCQCLYGFSGQTTSFNSGCSFYETLPPTAFPNIKVNERALTRNNLLATLTSLEKTYSVSFKLNLRSTSTEYTSVIHLTIGGNYGSYGDRIPGIFVISGQLFICSAVNVDYNYCKYSDPLPLNVWSSIKISQIQQNGVYKYKIHINESVISSTTNTNPQIFSNVYVYVANPWFYAADGSIKDLKITNENDYFNDKCADNWIYNENHCYFFNSITTKNWQDSYLSCLSYGGNLLSVADEAENLFVKNQLQDDTIKNQNFWIGLNDLTNENIFKWSDDTPVLIYNWMQNQPNNNGGNEDCVVASSVGWYDAPCDSHYGFICKTKLEFADLVEQKLVNNSLNTTLSLLEKTYSVSFKLKPRSYSQGWKSVIHLTIGGDSAQYGDRCPAVWFHSDGSGRLYISAAVNGNIDYSFTTQPLPLNQWSSLQISQFQTNGVYLYTIYLNELLVHSVINKKPQSFSNVKVYIADPWYIAQDGFIKDLKIITGFSVNERVLTSNNLLATLTSLEKTYSVSFKLYLRSITQYEKNVIHLTIGSNSGSYGDRISSVWTLSGRLYIYSAVNGYVNFQVYTDILPLNVWSNIKISQVKQNGLYKYKIYINESVIYSTTNTMPQTFSNVYVYVSNPWYNAADGSIKDLKIVNENEYFSDKCADDWIYNQNHCYFFNSLTTKKWQDSYSVCRNYGGDLLSIADEAENLFVINQLQDDTIKNQNFWIGLNDQINENIFEWSDKTPALIYNWIQNEPNNDKENEDCVIANSVGWNDVPCDLQFGFICKVKLETVDPVEQKLIKGYLNATLSLLEKTYSVSFKLKPSSYSKGWKSVIHLTIGEDYGQYGDRCPAVWFHSDGSGRLYISAVVNGNKDYTFTTQPLPLNQWSSLQISQFQTNGVYLYTIYLNELLVHSIINKKPQSFSNVKVYTADPWYNAQDGSIKDLKIISRYNGVWIPMMTRFGNWESSFWSKSYDAYENGFGLVNQQWIGLKKIYQITNTFFTDMRVDYVFEESITISTMYYNVIIGSSEDNYVFNYEKYDPRGSLEPDRFNANGMTFKNCSMWWTTNCDVSASPTSLYNISYGSTENLAAIYFSLRTKEIKGQALK